jgi:hypothetical protein
MRDLFHPEGVMEPGPFEVGVTGIWNFKPPECTEPGTSHMLNNYKDSTGRMGHFEPQPARHWDEEGVLRSHFSALDLDLNNDGYLSELRPEDFDFRECDSSVRVADIGPTERGWIWKPGRPMKEVCFSLIHWDSWDDFIADGGEDTWL